MDGRTPMTLVTGTLGSGKTTLIRRLLAKTGKKLALVMNEFGGIAVDSRIVQDGRTRIIALAGGCVCCELTGEFVAAIDQLLDRDAPDLILLEAAGVAEIDVLVYEVEEKLDRIRLDSVICIVDADTGIRFPQIGNVGRVQLEQADIILINKRDLVSDAQLAEITAQVRQFNDRAAIVATERCAGVEELWADLAERPPATRPPATTSRPHIGEARLESFACRTGKLERDAFSEWAETLPLQVFRAKGFVVLDGTGYLFNFVAGRWDLEEQPRQAPELVFIGPEIMAQRDLIIARLEQCAPP